MRISWTQRAVVCGLNALTGASWLYTAATLFHVPLGLAIATALAGVAVVGGGMRFYYRVGHRVERESVDDEFAEEARPLDRWAVALGMGACAAFFGFTVPRQLLPNLDSAIFVAPALTLALFLGKLGWRRPSLFYKNRQ